MRIRNSKQLNDFLSAVNKCKHNVWLESPQGDKFSLQSQLCRYVALGQLLSDKGDLLELFCASKDDEGLFYDFFRAHPEVCA